MIRLILSVRRSVIDIRRRDLARVADPRAGRVAAGRYLLPEDDGYVDALLANIRHKADLLGLPGDAGPEMLTAGPRRGFEVFGGIRIGATTTVRLDADFRLIGALREWGLRLSNIQGFGWVR